VAPKKLKPRSSQPRAPQAVLPIAEAFWRLIDAELANALKAAQKAANAFPPHRLIAGNVDNPQAVAALRALAAAQRRAQRQFRGRITRVRATGRPGSSAADRRDIPPSAWSTMGIDRLPQGIVRSRDRTMWYEVNVELPPPEPKRRIVSKRRVSEYEVADKALLPRLKELVAAGMRKHVAARQLGPPGASLESAAKRLVRKFDRRGHGNEPSRGW